MDKKIRVGVLFGGKSAEHEVSLQSAKNIIEGLDREKYEIVLIGIDRAGKWYLQDESRFLLNPNDPRHIKMEFSQSRLALQPGEKQQQLIETSRGRETLAIDVAFPVLHGPFGEDGTIQGLLKLANIPFVGAGVLGSAVGMDKDVMKRLLRDAALNIADFFVLRRANFAEEQLERMVDKLGLPLFVKPANLGSSVGIHKAENLDQLAAAIKDAFRFDHKVIVEEFIPGREIECAVLGNDEPIASVPGEIIPQHAFYSYEAKYIDENGALLEIPAKLPESVVVEIQRAAVAAYSTLCCEGMARVDFFLTPEGKVYINEINTIPGFTRISMYPKLWEASGIPYRELLDQLIALALRRHEQDSRLIVSPQ